MAPSVPSLRSSHDGVAHCFASQSSQRDGRRRNRALQGGEPGGPASVLGRYAPGDTGNPPFGTVVPSCWGARPGRLSATRSKVRTPARRLQQRATNNGRVGSIADGRADSGADGGADPGVGQSTRSVFNQQAANPGRQCRFRRRRPCRSRRRRPCRHRGAAARRSSQRHSRTVLASAQSAAALVAARRSAAG